MKNTTAPQFRMRVIALAASTLFFSQTSWALTLSTSPPGTIEPYVRPNIILSLDDSTSMNAKMY
jgi:type IV pilus assembly protein PilY1